MEISIFISAIIAGLIEVSLHYFPWELALRKKLPRVWAYVGGVLGLALPYSVMLILWIEMSIGTIMGALVGFWVICVVGGGAVMGSYEED